MTRRVARTSLALLALSAAFLAGRIVTPAAAEPPISGPVPQSPPQPPPVPAAQPPAVSVPAPAPGPLPLPPPAPGAETVPAKRYRVPMADSAMEWAHGDYVWVEELYLPDRGLVANVRWDYTWRADPNDPAKGEFVTIPRMTAFTSTKPRNQYRDLADNKIGRESPIEDIRIPAALVYEIATLADLARHVDDTKTSLGARAADGKWIRRYNAEGAEIPANPSAVPPPLPPLPAMK